MECGECTLCCDLFPVNWLNKPLLKKCIFCDKGCTIHSDKPAECTDFDCAYAQGKNVPLELRPDKCGIIFEKWSDKIFYGTVVPDMKVTDYAMKQINGFNKQGFSVILASIKERDNILFLADGHIEKQIKVEFNNLLAKNKWQVTEQI